MILKRIEKDNVIKSMYSSSNILASIYDKGTNELTLIFNKGGQYKYPNVKSSDYTRFELAESQGAVFNTHIKSYGFEKLPNINTDNIIKEIEDIKNADKKALVDAKKEDVIRRIAILGDDSTFTETNLKSLQTSINNYLSELNIV